MQRGIGHSGACQPDGSHHSLGRQHTGAAHLNHNVLHQGFLFLWGVLIGPGPPGKFGGVAKPFPGGQVIQLDDGTVNVAAELLPLLVDADDLLGDFFGIRKELVGNDLEMEGFQIFQGFRMAGKGLALCQLDVKYQNIQLPLGGDLGVFLPQRAGGGVPGVGKGLLPVFLQCFIQCMEGFLGHEYLAPDDEPGGSPFQRHGNGADGAQILRHILAHIAVAPGGTPDELAVHVFQGHRQAVDLRLHGELSSRNGLFGPHQKVIQLFQTEHILQAHQRHRMGHLAEGVHSLTAHPLGGRIRQGQLRVCLLQVLQLPQKTVIFKVRHGRVIQHVVPVARIV